MAFTLVTLTGSYGAGAAGTFTFTLTQPMTNGEQIVVPSPTSASLNSGGSLSVQLEANTDTDTLPQGVMWGVTEQIVGAQPRDYFIEIPGFAQETDGATTAGSDLVQLSTLTGEPWMEGLPIVGDGIPDETTITAILQNSGQLQLSSPTTATASNVTFTIGTDTIDISQLMPATQAWT